MSKQPINKFIAEYSWLVKYLIKKYCAEKIGDEDYYQIGLIGIWKAWEEIDEKQTNEKEIKTIIYNKVKSNLIDELRKETRQKYGGLRTDENGIKTISLEELTDIPQIDKTVEWQNTPEEEYVVIEFLDSLSDSERHLIKLKENAISNESIAKELSISGKTVQRRLKELREKTKKNFNK